MSSLLPGLRPGEVCLVLASTIILNVSCVVKEGTTPKVESQGKNSCWRRNESGPIHIQVYRYLRIYRSRELCTSWCPEWCQNDKTYRAGLGSTLSVFISFWALINALSPELKRLLSESSGEDCLSPGKVQLSLRSTIDLNKGTIHKQCMCPKGVWWRCLRLHNLISLNWTVCSIVDLITISGLYQLFSQTIIQGIVMRSRTIII